MDWRYGVVIIYKNFGLCCGGAAALTMAKQEPKRSSTLVFGGKAGAEEQVSNGPAEPPPLPPLPPPVTGVAHEPGVRAKPGKRSTESEVFDDGTNTFFW